MKRIAYYAYGSPDVLQMEDVSAPTPKDQEVRIRIRTASVTSTDSALRKGSPVFARLAAGLFKPRNPVLGSEFAGEIEMLGASVTRFKINDHVFGTCGAETNAHGELVCIPENGAVALMPENLTFEEAAALVEGGLTALPFLRDHGRLQPGDEILINGASGSVGTAAVQIARISGAHVTAVCSANNRDLVMKLGAERVIDYTGVDFTKSGGAYAVVFDAVGKSSFRRCRGLLNSDGVYLTTVPTLAIFPQMLWTSRIGRKRAGITFTGLRSAHEKTQDLNIIRELAESGEFRPVIDRCYRFEEFREAHQYVDQGHKRGNVILSVA